MLRWKLCLSVFVMLQASFLLGCQLVSEENRSAGTVTENGEANEDLAGELDSSGTEHMYVTGKVSISPSDQRLSADLRIRLRPQEDEGSESPYLAFLLNRGLSAGVTGHRVEKVHREPSPMSEDWHRIVVQLGDQARDQVVELDFQILGEPILPSNGINAIGEDWIELSDDSMWHPMVETVERTIVADLTFSFHDDWQLISSGETEKVPTGSRLVNQIPQVDIAFAASPDLSHRTDGHYTVHYRSAEVEPVGRALKRANQCRTLLDRRFGRTDPLPAGRFVISDRTDGGYARKNYVVLTDVSAMSPSSLVNFLCHELAHYWSSRARPFTVDNWLNEGFAELVATQAIRELVGEDAYLAWVDTLRERSVGLGTIWTAEDQTRRSYGVQYKKAPLALLRLEERIGPEAFEGLLVSYMAGIRTTQGLLDALGQTAGTDVAEWFSEVLAESDLDV